MTECCERNQIGRKGLIVVVHIYVPRMRTKYVCRMDGVSLVLVKYFLRWCHFRPWKMAIVEQGC
ncbi:hypothetical protein EMIT0P74_160071 [Pseudomonas sp. IT-P74]